MLTVFTPTYNREKEIERLYNSLKEQTNKSFEWLIVDDGSSDKTESVVNRFSEENIINIRYSKQKNAGKMQAHDAGVKLASGELFVCIDADDWLTFDAVEKILENYEKIKDCPYVAGLMFLNYDGDSDKIVGTSFPEDNMIHNYFDIYNKLGVKGDKTIVYKTSVIKSYPFPKIENEKFVPEALVYNRISRKYSLLCINHPIESREYLADGYTKNYFNVCKKSPKGQIIYYKELYELQPSLYNAAAYDLYCIYAKKSIVSAIKEHPSSFIALIMYIPAYIKYFLKERKK